MSHAQTEKCACSERTESLNVWICSYALYFLSQIPLIFKVLPNIYLKLHKAQNSSMKTKYVQIGGNKVELER